MPEIVVALDAKIDFIKMTNPFGTKEKDKKPQAMPSDDALKSMFARASRSRNSR